MYPRHILKLGTQIFRHKTFTIFKRWKQPTWINKLWEIHTLEYYSAMKWSTDICYNEDEPRKHYAKWKKLGTEGHMISFTGNMRVGKSIETERTLVVAKGTIWRMTA